MIGLLGKKCGMMRVFTEAGDSVPVTVIEVMANRVSQIKTKEKDGYDALQVVAGAKRVNKLTKPLAKHFAAAGVEAGDMMKEFRVDLQQYGEVQPGAEFKVDVFKEGQLVDVRGISRGKGFAGGVKRHNFRTQDASHGNSLSHRALGSTGQCQTPGKVLKGKKMPGQLGSEKCAVQNLQVVRIDLERNLLLVKGAVPGAPGGQVIVTPAVKKSEQGEQ